MLFSRVQQNLWKNKFFWLLSVLCLLLFLITACQSPRVSGKNTVHQLESLEFKSDKINIVLIQHDSCPLSYFWCAVRQGVSDATKNFNVNVTIERPDRGLYLPEDDAHIQKILFEEALKKDPCPDAIGVTLVDQQELKDSIEKAFCKPEKYGESPKPIPVVIYNSNSGAKKNSTRHSIYIGQDDRQAGYEAGLRLAQKVKELSIDETIKGVCIKQTATAENLQDRCIGFKQAMNENGIVPETLSTSSKTIDPVTMKKDIKTYYNNNPNTKIFLSLGPIGAVPFYEFEKEEGLQPGTFVHGTFDLSQKIIEEIKTGTTEFAVDQQPYLQGYLVVQWLTWIKRHDFEPYFEQGKDRIIPTGPFFVDISNLEKVATQVGQYR